MIRSNQKMEYLKRHLNDYEDATQKEPKAKHALISALCIPKNRRSVGSILKGVELFVLIAK